MEKIRFSKIELLDNYKTSDTGVQLVNDNVSILFITDPNKVGVSGNVIELYDFRKKPGISKRGIARCSLFVLLQQMVEDESLNVNKETIVQVCAPTATDRNRDRLLKIYKEIGFTQTNQNPNRPELKSSVQELIETLEKQCEMNGGGKYIKTKSRRRKSNKRRKTKINKKKGKQTKRKKRR